MCQTVWIQSRVQTVCKVYQQMTKLNATCSKEKVKYTDVNKKKSLTPNGSCQEYINIGQPCTAYGEVGSRLLYDITMTYNGPIYTYQHYLPVAYDFNLNLPSVYSLMYCKT